MDCRLMIGVDGGGTNTVAVAARPDGTITDYARGPGINYNNIGMDRARQNLHALLAGMPSVAQLGYARLCIGMSALDAPADAATAHAFAGSLFDADRLDLQSDAFIALMGLTCGGPGLIIICGTGSMLLAVDSAGAQHVLGGWGHLLGDTGSSHALALGGLRAAIDGWEGVGPETQLMDAALSHFGVDTPRALIGPIYDPDTSPATIAQFAREVLRLADGDPIAAGLVQQQMRHVARQAQRLLARYPEIESVGLYGGIFTHNPMVFEQLKSLLLAENPQLTVSFPTHPPELGALMHLLRQQDMLTPQALENMQRTYPTHNRQTGGITL